MAITEKMAEDLAKEFALAERALGRLADAIGDVASASNSAIGPITRMSLVNRVRGALGQVAQVHLDISAYDPRPRPRDGGGK